MDVHEAGLCCHVEAQLDVREEQGHAGQSACSLMLEELLVGVGDVVVRDRDRLDLRRQAFKRREVGVPRV